MQSHQDCQPYASLSCPQLVASSRSTHHQRWPMALIISKFYVGVRKKKIRNFHTVLEARGSKTKKQARYVNCKATWLVGSHHLTGHSKRDTEEDNRNRENLVLFSIGTNFIIRILPSCPQLTLITSRRPHLQISLYLDLELQHTNLREDII